MYPKRTTSGMNISTSTSTIFCATDNPVFPLKVWEYASLTDIKTMCEMYTRKETCLETGKFWIQAPFARTGEARLSRRREQRHNGRYWETGSAEHPLRRIQRTREKHQEGFWKWQDRSSWTVRQKCRRPYVPRRRERSQIERASWRVGRSALTSSSIGQQWNGQTWGWRIWMRRRISRMKRRARSEWSTVRRVPSKW